MNSLALDRLASQRTALLPGAFILLWSTGYIASKLALHDAGPFTLLLMRFSLVSLLLLVISLFTRAPWPSSKRQLFHLAVSGLLIQLLQFAGLYWGLKAGVSAGISALIVGTMPIVTALGANFLLGETITWRQHLGFAMRLAGIVLVVGDKIGTGHAGLAAYAAIGVALAGVTLGTLYQKRFCQHMDLRTGGLVQQLAAAAGALVLTMSIEGIHVDPTPELIGATIWLALVNSIGGFSLLYLLVRRGDASKVGSLFYLIPPVTAIMGFALLRETLSLLVLAGFAVTGSAVYFCTRRT